MCIRDSPKGVIGIRTSESKQGTLAKEKRTSQGEGNCVIAAHGRLKRKEEKVNGRIKGKIGFCPK